MIPRPDHIRCVRTGIESDKTSWCKRVIDPFEWAFIDATHAILNAFGGGYLLICPECAEAIKKLIDQGTG